ncbi:Ribosomal protein S12 methylthiotransferase RimO [bioreactor metagenome]|uniref:Ribosomal protein S12 methylthiotransferase RimO n=1 Tax=bioreactor metagenome TaxID=1076179 RepID=A0A644XIT2_9ZZZZ
MPEEVKQRRLGELMQAQQAVSAARNRARIGKRVEVLVEGYDGTRAYGRSYAEAPDVDGRVYFTAKTLPAVGSYVSVKLTEALEYDMIGELV